MVRTHELILYKQFEQGTIVQDMAWIMNHYNDDFYYKEDIRALLLSVCMDWLNWRGAMAMKEIFGIAI